MAEHSETPRLCHPLSRVSSRGRLGQPAFASGSPIFLPALSSPSPDVDQRPRLALCSPLRPTSVLACLWHLQAGPPQGSGSIGSPVQRADLRPRALQPVQISTGVLGDEVCRGPTPELLLQHSAGRRLIITERRKGEERGERWTRGLSPPRPPRSSSKVLPKSLQPLRTSLPSSLVLSRLPLASGPGCDVGQVQCEVRVSQNQPFRRSPL